MAKRGVIDHPKFARLKSRLGLSKYAALGVLEALWQMAGRYTPQGNIGKYDDADIEAWLEWDGKPGELVAALIECGWLNVNKAHRLIIHDWHDHIDNTTSTALKRSGLKPVTCPNNVSTVSQHHGDMLTPPEPEPEPEPEPITPLTPLAGGEQPEAGLATISNPVPEPYEWWLDYDSSSFERLLVEAVRGSPCYRSGVFLESDFGELARYVAGFAPDPITVENEIGRIGEWLAKKRKRPWADNPIRGLRAWFAKCESSWRGLRRSREYDSRKTMGTLDMLTETKRILAEGGSKLIALPIMEDELYAEG